ncbi:unnamed protein product [Polarella glacialis]|uniref:Uncharacterized protein n=1 Tax=Polarella glacialis TaxID=89957 RepID=A0A813HF09_POLGL|nr:unnamed protein product [Polarella glacialis]
MPMMRDLDSDEDGPLSPPSFGDESVRQLMCEDSDAVLLSTQTTREPTLRRHFQAAPDALRLRWRMARGPVIASCLVVLAIWAFLSTDTSSRQDAPKRNFVSYVLTQEQTQHRFDAFLSQLRLLKNETTMMEKGLNSMQNGFSFCGESVCDDEMKCCDKKLCCGKHDICCGEICCAQGSVCCPHVGLGACFAEGTECLGTGIEIPTPAPATYSDRELGPPMSGFSQDVDEQDIEGAQFFGVRASELTGLFRGWRSFRVAAVAAGALSAVFVLSIVHSRSSAQSASIPDVVSYVAMNRSVGRTKEVMAAVDDLQQAVDHLQDRIREIKEGMLMCGEEMCATPSQCCGDRMCCDETDSMCCDGHCCGASSMCCHGSCCGQGDVCCPNGLCGSPGSTCEHGIVLGPTLRPLQSLPEPLRWQAAQQRLELDAMQKETGPR